MDGKRETQMTSSKEAKLLIGINNLDGSADNTHAKDFGASLSLLKPD